MHNLVRVAAAHKEVMTTFIETDHPRGVAGKFAQKAFSADDVSLGSPAFHGIDLAGRKPFTIARALEGERAVFRLYGKDSEYSRAGEFVTDADHKKATVQFDGSGDHTVLTRDQNGRWVTEDGVPVRSYSSHVSSPFPMSPAPTPNRKGLSATQKDALEMAEDYGDGKIYTVRGNRTGFGAIGVDAFCWNQETIDSLVRRGLIAEDDEGDDVTDNWKGDAKLYRVIDTVPRTEG